MKYQANTPDTTSISGWTSRHRPRSRLMTVNERKPTPTPFVIENVNGITIIVRSTGIP